MSVSQIYWGFWVYLCQSNMLGFVGACSSVCYAANFMIITLSVLNSELRTSCGTGIS